MKTIPFFSVNITYTEKKVKKHIKQKKSTISPYEGLQ